MKIALLKLGGRVTPSDERNVQVSIGETHAVMNMLLQADPRNEITVFTKILESDKAVDSKRIKWLHMADCIDSVRRMNFDVCIIMNGNLNYFGGKDDFEKQTANMFIINRIRCPLVYILCDPALPFQQSWRWIRYKSWANKYRESDIVVKRRDVTYICQTFNTAWYSHRVSKLKHGIPGHQYLPFAFEKVVAFSNAFLKQGGVSVLPLRDREVDLSYGGTMRDGSRAQKMIDFYWGYPKDISVEMFGKITRKDFDSTKVQNKHVEYEGLRPPTFGPMVPYNDMLAKNQRMLAHVVIGDPIYYDSDVVPHRTYESLLAGTLTLIDSALDPQRRVYGNHKSLSKWLYASDREHVAKVLRQVKRSPQLLLDLVRTSQSVTEFDHSAYCKEFMQLVKSAIR
jgi:hypothetical protein